MLEFFEKNLPFLIIVSIVGSYVLYSVKQERKEEEKRAQEKKEQEKNSVREGPKKFKKEE